LYQLSDLSLNSHTALFLAEKIEEVIKKIGPEKFAAIVSDNAANIRNARIIISEKYPHIENIRCIAHCINLIACDIASYKFSERLLRRVNIIVTFFNSSHLAGKLIILFLIYLILIIFIKFLFYIGAKLRQLIEENNIIGGGLKLYCKTRWTTSSESVNSILNLKFILEKVLFIFKLLIIFIFI
jgi:hypothetical protein